jgi:hypothetical protein
MGSRVFSRELSGRVLVLKTHIYLVKLYVSLQGKLYQTISKDGKKGETETGDEEEEGTYGPSRIE